MPRIQGRKFIQSLPENLWTDSILLYLDLPPCVPGLVNRPIDPVPPPAWSAFSPFCLFPVAAAMPTVTPGPTEPTYYPTRVPRTEYPLIDNDP